MPEKRDSPKHVEPKLKEGDLVLVKDHIAKPFQPRFKGNSPKRKSSRGQTLTRRGN